ncbi:MAG TPA: CoA-binding protein [Alphaproteobacteria bacterium]|nr:CoA-binding protein [Alphaproteobacteria bacterium]
MTATAAAAPDHDAYTDDYIRGILRRVRTIAMVGASPNWNRPSYFAMKYLQHKGYRVIPVNPVAAGQSILGEKVYATLKDIPDPVDMVDIFRNSDAAGPITDEAIAIGAKVVWMQLGVRNDAAKDRAEAAGLTVVMNRCPKIEYGRLHGELSWSGINSGIISAKRPRLMRVS